MTSKAINDIKCLDWLEIKKNDTNVSKNASVLQWALTLTKRSEWVVVTEIEWLATQSEIGKFREIFPV